jgi:hypothetical protein
LVFCLVRFDSLGSLLAVGSDDGNVCIYDFDEYESVVFVFVFALVLCLVLAHFFLSLFYSVFCLSPSPIPSFLRALVS